MSTASVFAVAKVNNANDINCIFGRAQTSLNSVREALLYVYRPTSEVHFQVANGSSFPTATKAFTYTDYSLFTGVAAGTTGSMNVYRNGSAGVSSTSISSGITSGNLWIGGIWAYFSIDYYLSGRISEIVAYNSDQTSNLAAIHKIIRQTYNTY